MEKHVSNMVEKAIDAEDNPAIVVSDPTIYPNNN